MYANKVCPAAAGEIAVELPQVLRVYKDGRIERLLRSPFVPASEHPGAAGVATRDVTIDRDTGVAARLFLPSGAAAAGRRLPVLVYFHGGAFLSESAFGRRYHRYATSLAARAGALVVLVEYRLAPEHPVPTPYDDAWTALGWAASFSDPWLAGRADRGRVFLAGDSSGGSMAYHTAVRASRDGGVDMEGLILVHPYFWGSDRLPSELASESFLKPDLSDKLWSTATAGRASSDDPRINPADEDVASLKCRRALVAVAEKDLVRERGRRFAARMRDYGWGANVTLVESAGEDHAFHLADRDKPPRASVTELLDHIAEFINKEATSPSSLPRVTKSSL
ncbi:hypothetical protein ACP70R_005705 [Stipagrostis hirtigluma subsp. patula]